MHAAGWQAHPAGSQAKPRTVGVCRQSHTRLLVETVSQKGGTRGGPGQCLSGRVGSTMLAASVMRRTQRCCWLLSSTCCMLLSVLPLIQPPGGARWKPGRRSSAQQHRQQAQHCCQSGLSCCKANPCTFLNSQRLLQLPATHQLVLPG